MPWKECSVMDERPAWSTGFRVKCKFHGTPICCVERASRFSKPQLALDPCVAKFHDSSSPTVSLLGFFTGHLLAERDHYRAFFEVRY